MLVTVTKEEATAGVLPAGQYGSGMETEAIVELIHFSYPAVRNPGYDKNAERGPWALFTARVLLETGQSFLIDKHVDATGLKKTLLQTGAIPEPDGNGGWTVRFYQNPMVPWIWYGALMMAAGGFLSLSDRRHRVGVPQRPRLQSTKVAAGVAAAE